MPKVCSVCGPVVFQAAFAQSDGLLAFIVPNVVSSQNRTAFGGLFMARMQGGSPAVPTAIALPLFHNLELIGLTADAASVLLQLDRKLYSYNFATRGLILLAGHVDTDYRNGLLPALAFHP
jgi:hypothetical protein